MITRNFLLLAVGSCLCVSSAYSNSEDKTDCNEWLNVVRVADTTHATYTFNPNSGSGGRNELNWSLPKLSGVIAASGKKFSVDIENAYEAHQKAYAEFIKKNASNPSMLYATPSGESNLTPDMIRSYRGLVDSSQFLKQKLFELGAKNGCISNFLYPKLQKLDTAVSHCQSILRQQEEGKISKASEQLEKDLKIFLDGEPKDYSVPWKANTSR